MMLLSDPAIRALAWGECGEPLVDVRSVGGLRLDGRLADADGAYARLRIGVVDRLLRAQEALPTGLHLLVVEGFRPPALQRAYFAQYSDEVRATHPELDEAAVHVEASKYISPPEVAPHCTGAAVDLTLCDDHGVELDLGTRVNASPIESRNRCYTASPDLDPEARRTRDLLVAALTGAGLVNYPTEWWHWSYGDRYWAATTGRTATRYAPLESED